MELDGLTELVVELGHPKFRAEQLRGWRYDKGAPSRAAVWGEPRLFQAFRLESHAGAMNNARG
jgi:hypothetical protein